MTANRFSPPCPRDCEFNLVGDVGQSLGCACKCQEFCPGYSIPDFSACWLFTEEEKAQFRDGMYYRNLLTEGRYDTWVFDTFEEWKAKFIVECAKVIAE